MKASSIKIASSEQRNSSSADIAQAQVKELERL
jgi:hypothetical protein